MDKDAGGMPGTPGSVGHLVPFDAVGRMPDVIAVCFMVTFHDPKPIVEDGDLVILSRRPWRCQQTRSGTTIRSWESYSKYLKRAINLSLGV